MEVAAAHFILYVADQPRSAAFYTTVLGTPPTLDVPGMTEFQLGTGTVLGLMPGIAIKRLLGSAISNPLQGSGPRAELYLVVPEVGAPLERALAAGARLLSPLQERNWGDNVAYVADPDGHVLAFAERPQDAHFA